MNCSNPFSTQSFRLVNICNLFKTSIWLISRKYVVRQLLWICTVIWKNWFVRIHISISFEPWQVSFEFLTWFVHAVWQNVVWGPIQILSVKLKYFKTRSYAFSQLLLFWLLWFSPLFSWLLLSLRLKLGDFRRLT